MEQASRVVTPRVFTHGERRLGLLGFTSYVRKPDKMHRALHNLYTVIYTTEGWCKRCLAQNKCSSPHCANGCADSRVAGSRGWERPANTGWDCWSPALPVSHLALCRYSGLCPHARTILGLSACPVARQLSPMEYPASLNHSGCSHTTLALCKQQPRACGQVWT